MFPSRTWDNRRVPWAGLKSSFSWNHDLNRLNNLIRLTAKNETIGDANQPPTDPQTALNSLQIRVHPAQYDILLEHANEAMDGWKRNFRQREEYFTRWVAQVEAGEIEPRAPVRAEIRTLEAYMVFWDFAWYGALIGTVGSFISPFPFAATSGIVSLALGSAASTVNWRNNTVHSTFEYPEPPYNPDLHIRQTLERLTK